MSSKTKAARAGRKNGNPTRRPWAVPRMRRLATSDAEVGTTVQTDFEGHS